MKPYRCQNSECSEDAHGRLIFDFWADAPVCPKCGTDGRTQPSVVIELAVVHYDPPHPKIKQTPHCTHKGTGFRACAPTTSIGTTFGTGNPTAANCPQCRATDAWKKAMAEWGEETPTKNIELQLNRQTGILEAVGAGNT